MNIENLKTFLTLSELKNFTQTADQYYIVQSTVTNRIMELEKELGKKLFIRQKKSVELTEEGRRFLPYAKRIVELEHTAVMELGMLHSFAEHLRIGTVNTVYDCHLTKCMSRILRECPDISVKVIIDHSNKLIRMLQDGTLDVIFTFVPTERTGFTCIPFQTDELVLVTSWNKTEYEKGITRDILQNLYYLYCDFVLGEGGNFMRDIFPKKNPFPFEIDKSTKLLPYLLDGIGYSFLPRSFVGQYLEDQRLREIPLLDFAAPVIQSYFITKDLKTQKKAVADFKNMIYTTGY
ncbi:LysR family transcriptional regulator [Robinsoniella peoriensis]|uniref:LysR family transcriptional regulator n=1 Tax=Robinsoniella peoriensis TaxID=180332 RepID=UPI00085CAC7C|nr:LysR family transcriptional regulator [Robinsoniella peoriensis]